MNMFIDSICNRCSAKYHDIFVARDNKGYPSLVGIICQECGGHNCMSRDLSSGGIAQSLIPPAENGEINRFEYSYRDDSGKLHQKKLDPKSVQKHGQKNS